MREPEWGPDSPNTTITPRRILSPRRSPAQPPMTRRPPLMPAMSPGIVPPAKAPASFPIRSVPPAIRAPASGPASPSIASEPPLMPSPALWPTSPSTRISPTLIADPMPSRRRDPPAMCIRCGSPNEMSNTSPRRHSVRVVPTGNLAISPAERSRKRSGVTLERSSRWSGSVPEAQERRAHGTRSRSWK